MKSPLWLINSTLALFIMLSLFFLFALSERPPRPAPLTPQPAADALEPAPKVTVSAIYENDLFGTYIPEEKAPEEVAGPLVPQPPQPPIPQAAQQPARPKPEFFPPLNVVLKGIINSTDTDDNRAFIERAATKEEKLYQVGDTIEDAEIIHIAKNKVILIRSNGQQETLFISPKAAEHDAEYIQFKSWKDTIQQSDAYTYTVKMIPVAERITSFAEFLDLLDATTAFDKGVSIGVRVGVVPADGFATALGLQSGDIITAINSIPVNSTQSRVKAYKHVIGLSRGDSISVSIQRQNKPLVITYILYKPEEKKYPITTHNQATLVRDKDEEKKANFVLQQNSNTMKQDLKKRDKHAMLRHGTYEKALQRKPAAE